MIDQTGTAGTAAQVRMPIRRVAYHEAGHAVACITSHIRFTSVTSIPGDRSAGCIRLLPGQQSHGDRDFAWVMSAGVVADRVDRGRDDFTLNTIRNWHRYGWLESDILTLLEAYPDKPRLLALVKYAVAMARAYWPAVEAIAGALIDPATLCYDDARSLFMAAKPEFDPGRVAGLGQAWADACAP